jgi:shikimate kinase
MKDTRTYVLGLIQDWAYTPSPGLSIFWLAGMAGTGKSTIAKTACEKFAEDGVLGASFFVSRQEIERRDPHRVLRSIAYQLALKDPTAFREVHQRVTAEHGVSSRPPLPACRRT